MLSPKELAVLGTAVAVELAKGKTEAELKEIKALVGQIHATLSTLIIKH